MLLGHNPLDGGNQELARQVHRQGLEPFAQESRGHHHENGIGTAHGIVQLPVHPNPIQIKMDIA